MAAENMNNVVLSLTAQEEDGVRRFIDYLRRRDFATRSESSFLAAADEFISQHPELLQRLAR